MAKLSQEEQNFLLEKIATIRKANEAIIQNTASIHAASVAKEKTDKDLNDFYAEISNTYFEGKVCEINLETMEVSAPKEEKDAAE